MMIFGSKGKKREETPQQDDSLFGSQMTFAAKEAYKLLRTNLMFSLPEQEEGRARIIGVTSSLQSEGKSTTTVNLARTLAEQGERVLIVEGDLRLPTMHKKLKVYPKPGLSNILATRVEPTPYIQQVQVGTIGETAITFDVLVAGDIPPNPSELIGSNRMKRRLEQLARNYHFILIDLPPITVVTDALVATKLLDGVIMVVRSDYADTGSLKEAVRQIKLVGGKILGFVFTYANSGKSGYRRKYKYKYKYKYDYGYDREKREKK